MVLLEAVDRGIAQAPHVERREQVLVEPHRHKEVEGKKALRCRPGGESDADLFAKLAGREPLRIDLDVGVGIIEKPGAFLIPGGLSRVVVGPDRDCQRTLRLRAGAPPEGRDTAGSYTCCANSFY